MFANGPNGKVPGTKPQAPEIWPRPIVSGVQVEHLSSNSTELQAGSQLWKEASDQEGTHRTSVHSQALSGNPVAALVTNNRTTKNTF